MKNGYEVGYGKPPKKSRFKAGRSGNPKGRPRGSKNTYTMLRDILDQKITIKEGGEELRITKKQALLMQLVNKGIKGDMKAITAVFPHVLMVDIKEEDKQKFLNTIHADDQEIIQAYMFQAANLGRMLEKSIDDNNESDGNEVEYDKPDIEVVDES